VNTQRQIGFVFLAAAMVLVGSTVVASKIIGAGMPPFMATALRFAISSLVFAGALWLSRERLPKLSGRDWLLLVIQGAAGSFAYTVLLIIALTFTSAVNAGVILGTLPLVMGVLAITAFGERPSRPFMLAIVLATLGVGLVTLKIGTEGVSLPKMDDAIGIAILLVAVVCEALFLVLNKKLMTPVPTLTLSALMSVFGLLLALVPAGLEMAWGGLIGITQSALLGVVYYALVPTFLGFLLWYGGAARTTTGEAALFTAILPISALVLAALILGEPITVRQGAGCLFVIVAIVIGVKRR